MIKHRGRLDRQNILFLTLHCLPFHFLSCFTTQTATLHFSLIKQILYLFRNCQYTNTLMKKLLRPYHEPALKGWNLAICIISGLIVFVQDCCDIAELWIGTEVNQFVVSQLYENSAANVLIQTSQAHIAFLIRFGQYQHDLWSRFLTGV